MQRDKFGILAATILKHRAPSAALCCQRDALEWRWGEGMLHDLSHENVLFLAAVADGGGPILGQRSNDLLFGGSLESNETILAFQIGGVTLKPSIMVLGAVLRSPLFPAISTPIYSVYFISFLFSEHPAL